MWRSYGVTGRNRPSSSTCGLVTFRLKLAAAKFLEVTIAALSAGSTIVMFNNDTTLVSVKESVFASKQLYIALPENLVKFKILPRIIHNIDLR